MINRIEKHPSLGERVIRTESDASLSLTKQRMVALWRGLETEMADHPTKSLFAALSIGVLLGWIIKRH
jgi:hypothetical protein